MSSVYSLLRRSLYQSVAREMNPIARSADSVLYAHAGEDRLLFELTDAADKRFLSLEEIESEKGAPHTCRLITLNGHFNSSLDIQGLLSRLKPSLCRRDRVLVVLYNPYLRWLHTMMDRLGLRTGPAATTFVTRRSLESLATLSGFQLVRLRPAASFPFRLLGVGTLLDGLMKATPLVRLGALVNIAVLRPVIQETAPPSLSIVIPARNEEGNIRSAIERIPVMPGVRTEVIFVEGGSTDDTAGEIRRVIDGYSGPLELRSYTQTGKGKGDAVRRGFAHATGDLLTILDADLTMPPEMLPRFYDAWSSGLGDFVSGNRLLYPMEGEAMRFLNTLGNVFFCKALAWILEAPLGDTLCGTKLLSRRDWNRVTRWRDDFGDFDPFGDFELLFSAAAMSLGIVEVPVHYRARTYGETNIHRFRHGLMLAKMSVIGLVRIRMGLGRSGKRR
jgi:hypothetical protein